MMRYAGIVRSVVTRFYDRLERADALSDSWIDACGEICDYLSKHDRRRLREWDPRRGRLGPYLFRVIRDRGKVKDPTGDGELEETRGLEKLHAILQEGSHTRPAA